jgi:D-alanine--D-alanine ligase
MRTPQEIETQFAPREVLDGFDSFYLVGIGGAGMSGLALMLQHRGYQVAGSDSTPSPMTAELISRGIEVRIGQSGEGILLGQAVVLSDAIPLDAPEVRTAKMYGCPVFRRSQLLGWLLKDKKVLAVTGTHGKTTTTGMLASGLVAAGLDPTIVVGAAVPEFGGPIVEGEGEYAVVEACEAYDSFHDLDPFAVLLTNLELDHVDYHGDYESLRNSVWRFVSHIPEGGALVYCDEDEGARDVAERFTGSKISYRRDDFPLEPAMPGAHNRLNAAGALAVATFVAPQERGSAAEGIARFQGAERRLQVLRDGPIVVVDDYAHHPTEVRASIKALRERYPDRRLVVVFQPHLYSRTAGLIQEFAEALSLADHLVITDIYPAREAPMPGVSSARIAEAATTPTEYVPSRHLLPRKVASMVRPGDVVVGMGAGSIGEFAPHLVQELDRHPPGATPSGDGSAKAKVAVILGGDSAEREVSLHSGEAVLKALQARGYDAYKLDITEALLSGASIQNLTGARRPDVAFLAVHGTHAEDGAFQGFFEMLHIPYTGSGIQASAIAMDKRLTKEIWERFGIRVPRGIQLHKRDADRVAEAVAEAGLRPPLIVKPNAQGSTVGLAYIEDDGQMAQAVERALHYDESVLIEEWIKGMEISVPVLGDRPLPPVEIAPRTGFYDFASKYLPGATEEIVPARLPEAVLLEAQQIALEAHRAIGCEGATRTDMMVRDDEIFVLEINTLPGLTGTSLLPNSALAAGISFEDLVEWIVQDALRRHGAKA